MRKPPPGYLQWASRRTSKLMLPLAGLIALKFLRPHSRLESLPLPLFLLCCLSWMIVITREMESRVPSITWGFITFRRLASSRTLDLAGWFLLTIGTVLLAFRFATR